MRKIFALVGGCLLGAGFCGVAAEGRLSQEKAWQKPAGFLRKESLVASAARLETEGAFKAAADVYRRMAVSAVNASNRAFARVRQGDCHFAAEEFADSWRAYDAALGEAGARVSYDHVLGRLRLLASGFLRGEGVFLGVRNVGMAIDVYERILEVSPTGAEAAQDRLVLAELFAERGDVESAKVLYREVIRRYPNSQASVQARVAIGNLLVQEMHRHDADGQMAREARRHLSTVKVQVEGEEAAQASVLLQQAVESLAEHLYQLGEFYTRQVHYRPLAARRYLHDVQRQYPGTLAATKAAVLLKTLEHIPEEDDEAVEKTLAEKLAEPPKESRVVTAPEPDPVKPGPEWRAPKEGELRKWLLPLEDLGLGEE